MFPYCCPCPIKYGDEGTEVANGTPNLFRCSCVSSYTKAKAFFSPLQMIQMSIEHASLVIVANVELVSRQLIQLMSTLLPVVGGEASVL